MKKLQVDRGAIKFVLSGANIMCPGLTSPGGALDDQVEAETPVVMMIITERMFPLYLANFILVLLECCAQVFHLFIFFCFGALLL